MRSFILILGLCIAGCANSDQPPPAKIGAASIYFVPQDQIAAVCHHPKSEWVAACTNMLTKQIILPLPQDFPGDPYAYLVQFELAHVQQDWPDPPDIRERLIQDAQK